jgi:undecaprenyl-diphosphatase
MEEFLKNIFMGLVQGFSEFLPISSSGHLVLFSKWLDVQEVNNTQLLLSVVVHLGTLCSVLVFFRSEVKKMLAQLPALPAFIKSGFVTKTEEDQQAAMICYIIIASVPAALVGFTFKDELEALFSNRNAVIIALAINAVMLWSSRYTVEKFQNMSAFYAIIIGCGQAMAIVPGISRSGTTIVFAMWLGLTRSKSAAFSFLLSIPVILGASLLELKDTHLASINFNQWINFGGAALAAALSGFLAIKLLYAVVQKQKFEYFAIYCLSVSAISFCFN